MKTHLNSYILISKRMKKFIINLSLITCLAIIIVSVLVVLPGIRDDYSMIYDTKVKKIQTLSSPKLVLMGGSSVAFGYNTKVLSDSLHINAYNFGVTSEFGQKYIIEDISRFLKKGDILVVSLEYITFLKGDGIYGCKTEMCELLFRNKYVNWPSLNWNQVMVAVSGLPLICQTNLKRIVSPQSTNDSYFHYTKLGFNEFGDEDSHLNLLPTMNPVLERNNFELLSINKEFTEYYASQLKKIADRGVKVVCLPGMMGESEYSYEKNYILRFISLWKDYGGSIDGTVDDYIVPDDFLFDYPYHMNKKGVAYITQTSLKDIQSSLN